MVVNGGVGGGSGGGCGIRRGWSGVAIVEGFVFVAVVHVCQLEQLPKEYGLF